MNVTDAAYVTVHQYPGGSEALTPRLGMSAAVLRGKVNPNGDSNFAQMGGPYSLTAVRSSSNTVFHDRTKDVGGLLANPPYGVDVLATVPVYDTGDGAGAVHTRFGMVWELVRAMQAGYGSAV